MVNQLMKIMVHYHLVFKIDLVVFDQQVHIHQHVQHHQNQMKQIHFQLIINHYGIVQILNSKLIKVHFKMVNFNFSKKKICFFSSVI